MTCRTHPPTSNVAASFDVARWEGLCEYDERGWPARSRSVLAVARDRGLARSAYRRIRISTPPFLISQAVRAGNLLFLSGQAAVAPSGEIVGAGDFDRQAEQVFENLEAVLRAGGSDLSKVIKVTIYVTDMAVFPKILELRERYFDEPYPADTIVQIEALGLPELELEIEAVAIIDGPFVN